MEKGDTGLPDDHLLMYAIRSFRHDSKYVLYHISFIYGRVATMQSAVNPTEISSAS